MEKENKKIFYTELLSKTEQAPRIETIKLSSFKETKKKIKKIKKNKIIEIWGATSSKKHKKNEIIKVNDHINFTGNNPLIGKQGQIKTSFPDMASVYKKTEKGIITTSRGKHFLLDEEYEYPTEKFCYFGIIARALGIKQIKGYLINKDINSLKKHIFAKNAQN